MVQNIFGVKIRHQWQAGSRVRIPSGKCFMCHITPQCMEQHYLGPLLPSPGTNPGFQGSKNDYFWVKIRLLWQAGSRERIPPGKWLVFDVAVSLGLPSAIKVPGEVKKDPYTCLAM